MKLKLSEFVAAFGWLSVFCSAWMIFSRIAPSDSLSWTLFAFFLIVAILASAMTMERKR